MALEASASRGLGLSGCVCVCACVCVLEDLLRAAFAFRKTSVYTVTTQIHAHISIPCRIRTHDPGARETGDSSRRHKPHDTSLFTFVNVRLWFGRQFCPTANIVCMNDECKLCNVMITQAAWRPFSLQNIYFAVRFKLCIGWFRDKSVRYFRIGSVCFLFNCRICRLIK